MTMPTPEVNDSSDDITPPSAKSAERRIHDWYSQVPLEVGVHLTDPNVVLTLADVRGMTEFYIDDSPTNTDESLQNLNAMSQPDGVRFLPETHTNQISGRVEAAVTVQNLAGYQRTTDSTRLPGVPRFAAADGFETVDTWLADAIMSVRAASENGHYPRPLTITETAHLIDGVIRGYPDAAIISSVFAEEPDAGQKTDLVRTQIANADFYPNSQPNFIYHPQDQASVEPVVQLWGQILTDYYASDGHQDLAGQAEFQELRAERQPAEPEETEAVSDPAAAAETRLFVSYLNEARDDRQVLEDLRLEALELAEALGRLDLVRAITLGQVEQLANIEDDTSNDKLTSLKELGAKMEATIKHLNLVEDQLAVIHDRNS